MEKVLGDDSVLLPGVINGRPPDQGVLIPVPTKLERVALPISEEDQKVVKRSRGEGKVYDERLVSEKDGEEHTKPSFKDMLTGRRSEGSNTHVIPELDVEINDEDV
ncbi:hypothetical protein V6N12_030571 [Hibiscus sabdariffa]|uniref:Uncharacterized protein n=1 Tax=Hibiscus sabdariffa TaxID=183260 RepID=A0ABR1ZJA7_9ROSI